MAEQGYVLDIDTKFIQRLEQADAALEKFISSTERLSAQFDKLASGGLQKFAGAINNVSTSVDNIASKNVGDLGMNKTAQDAVDVVDKINDIGGAIDKILVNNKAYTNGALTRVNQEIEESVEKLSNLQELIDFYTKGEGKKSPQYPEYFDSLADEANALVDRIELLEAERETIKETAAAKIKAQLEALASQKKIDEEWAPIFKEREERERQQAVQTEKEAQRAAKLSRATEAAEAKAAAANKKKAQSVIDNYNKEVDAARKAHEAQRKMYERLWKETEYRERTTYGGAMSFSQGTTSINQQIQAIKYLKEARLNLSKTSFGSETEYKKAVKNITDEIKRQEKEIDELIDKNGDLKNSHNELLAVLGTVFSVQAIRGYINQVAAVRGEFELQQRSLQALLQNKKEANQLWQQTVQLAVKSPLQVKQLVTATKQLAAYRVESQKLHQTTRMLADISQGLGVDMDRLILAFGQVKAANFLRGTELRQFSEAGINILDELANYYTVLEGKTVTVSQVFERVSKRMVSFGDVEKVLQRVTSAGGMFYKMQEIQAETLKGQMSNLRDQIDLMLNEIGEKNEGIMKGGVQLFAWLIKNYKAFVPMLSAVTVAFTAMQFSMIKAKLGAEALSAGMASLRAVLISPWTYILTALAVVVSEFASYKHEMNQIETTHKRFKESLIEMQAAMNDAMNVEKIEDAREALARLLEAAQKDFGVDFGLSPEDIQKMDLSALKNKFAEIRQNLFDADVIAQQLSESFAKDKKLESTFVRFGKAFFTYGISGKGGESMEKDFNDLQDSANTLMSLLQRLGLELAANEDIQLPANHPLRMIQDGKESDLVYLERLISAFKDIRGKAIKAEVDVSGIDKALRIFDKAYEEAAKEGDRFLNKSVENLASYAPEVIKASINQFIDDNEWDDFSRELMLRLRGQSLEVDNSTEETDDDLNKPEKIEKVDTRYQNLIRTIKEMNSAYKDLSKTFDDVTAREGTMVKYADALDDVLSQITINGKKLSSAEFMELFDVTTEGGMLAALDKISEDAPQIADRLKAKLEKGEITWEAKVSIKEDADKDLMNRLEDLFSGYELSIELDKLNMPSDMARQFFNVEAFSLDEVRNKLAAMEHEFVGTEMEDEYEKALKRIDEMEDNAQRERIKKYVQYLVKGQGERVRIKLEEMRKIAEIESLPFDYSQKKLAKQAVEIEAKQQIDKLEWEEFKQSGAYVQLFEDLEYASNRTLQMMRDKLIELKGSLSNLDADDLKHLYNQIEKLEEELAERNPYRTLSTYADEYIKTIGKQRAIEQELAKADTHREALQDKADAIDFELAKEKQIYNQMSKSNTATKDDLNKQREKIGSLNIQLSILKSQLLAQGKLTDELRKQLSNIAAVRKMFTGSAEEIGNDISSIASAIPEVAGHLESVFGTMSAGTKDAVDSISEIGQGIGSAISGIASGNYVQAVAGIAKALGGIFSIGDKSKEREIQAQIGNVAKLEKEYNKLEKAIEKAYSTEQLEVYSSKMNDVIDQQIASYEAMRKLEEDKKKTDQSKLDQYDEAIDELKESRRDLNEEISSKASGGILDDAVSAAEGFVDAWLEAFNETGDGISGLEAEFKDMITNLMKRQAAMQIVGAYTDMYSRWLKDYINPDGGDVNLTAEEAREWAEKVKSTFPELSAALESFFSGTQDLMQEQGELSELSKGIQGITETTAQVLEALLNSMRFYVADSNTQLKNIAAAFASNDIERNPLLNELRQQTALVRSIESMFDSVIGRGSSSHSGGYIKVLVG